MRPSFPTICFLMAPCLLCFSDEKPIQPEPPVKVGLLAWIDAEHSVPEELRGNRVATVSQAPAIPVLRDLAQDREWRAISSQQANQPKWIAHPVENAESGPTIRFDGESAAFAATLPRGTTRELTVFVVFAPKSNMGSFRGILSGSKSAANDYVSGFSLDLDYGASVSKFDSVNLEGVGFQGANNLLRDSAPLGSFQLLSAVVGAGPGAAKLFRDGAPQGLRDRTDASIALEELRLGARLYSNEPAKAPYEQGFLDGDIAELLFYNRALPDDERSKVEGYLREKHKVLLNSRLLSDAAQATLTIVDPAPDIQFLTPGYRVRELPIDLTNVNNVLYREDGKLVALTYRGEIWLLSDTDGDGLEDTAKLYFDGSKTFRGPIGMRLTPPNYPHGSGVFVPSKGKLSLIVDRNGDDMADEEVIVATGWEEIAPAVDALGVDLDKEGNVYFGLGCADYANAYQVDAEGKSQYRIDSERGTILKVAPDFSKREVVCTGIRFPVGLMFNRLGDLFCTDQEGATWLPNGNPFDELLHIEKGKHYGFPPKHPKHLPNVVNSPSVINFAPQHQSACGLYFNEAKPGLKSFGPENFEGDALVAGYSRGKLYRVKLVKTEHGYVGEDSILACSKWLVPDLCVSPQGDLVVAAHSGGPDWGTGPEGKGKLFKVRYVDQEEPQVAAIWPQSPTEVRIAFDRPFDLERAKGLLDRIEIQFGEYVRAGDRFETQRPGYAVVVRQVTTPRYRLAVHSVSVTPDRRTLILTTDPHVTSMRHSVTIRDWKLRPAAQGESPQEPDLDLEYDFHGVQAFVKDMSTKEVVFNGWLPHVDKTVSQALTRGSYEHEELFRKANGNPFQAQLNYAAGGVNLFEPVVQPGSKLDYEPEIDLSVSTEFRVNGLESGAKQSVAGLPPVALPLSAIRLSWESAPIPNSAQPVEAPPVDLAAWNRGREVFLGAKSKCSSCHQMDGVGGKIGPSLANLRHRDEASVTRDIVKPSFAINPDFITNTVLLHSGKQLVGVLRSQRGKLILSTNESKEFELDPNEIESISPSAISTMPEKLLEGIDENQKADLFVYLLGKPPEEFLPAPIVRADAPPPRKESELEGLIQESKELRPLKIVLATGPKDHDVNEHDYPQFRDRWLKLLALAPHVDVKTADQWPSSDDLAWADTIVFYSNNPAWTGDKAKDLDAFLKRGGGLVFIHFAINGQAAPEILAERIGLVCQVTSTRYRHGPLELRFPKGDSHPITKGLPPLKFVDESYWNLIGDPSNFVVLAEAEEEGAFRPQMWTREAGEGRVFVSIPGHYSWTFDDPVFRAILLRGICWTAHHDPHQLDSLTTIGARVAPK